MNDITKIELPFYAKATIVLFGLMLLMFGIWVSADIVTPFAFATLLAILLNPINLFFQRRRIPTLISIILTVLCGALILAGIFYFMATQISDFADAAPKLKARLQDLLQQGQHWLSSSYNISAKKQVEYLNKMGDNAGTYIGTAFSTVSGVLILFTLVPVYVFLILLYQNLIVNFIIQAFSGGEDREKSNQVHEILHKSKVVIQSYVVGLFMEAGIIAVMQATALLIMGIPYAILLGVIGALLNMVPYLGGLIAISLPVLMALITKNEVSYIFIIIGVYIGIQFIDNNIIVPRIVGSKVKINALASLLAVLIGGALAGLSGMFLSLPMVAIFKIIFDRVESLKPYGMLLGDDIPEKRIPLLNVPEIKNDPDASINSDKTV